MVIFQVHLGNFLGWLHSMLFLASRFEAASSTNSLSSSSVTKVVTCMNERAAGELNRTLMNRSSLCLSRGARAGSPPALSSSSSVPHITFSYCLLNTMMMVHQTSDFGSEQGASIIKTKVIKIQTFWNQIVFETHRKSLIQYCERSELRLQFEWTKVD